MIWDILELLDGDGSSGETCSEEIRFLELCDGLVVELCLELLKDVGELCDIFYEFLSSERMPKHSLRTSKSAGSAPPGGGAAAGGAAAEGVAAAGVATYAGGAEARVGGTYAATCDAVATCSTTGGGGAYCPRFNGAAEMRRGAARAAAKVVEKRMIESFLS